MILTRNIQDTYYKYTRYLLQTDPIPTKNTHDTYYKYR